MDYAALPPETNSTNTWTGPGSASLMASMVAWQGIMTEHAEAAMAFAASVAQMGMTWQGPSSLAMLAAAAPYVGWLATTAAQAEEKSIAAGTLASQFETARTGVVHPAEVAENRAELAAAIGGLPWTAPYVAELETDYARMWAQDAGTLLGYAAAANSTIASVLPSMVALPNSDGGVTQAGADAAAAASPQGTGQSTVGSTMSQLGSLPGQLGSAASQAQQGIGQGQQALTGAIPQMMQHLTSGGQHFGDMSGHAGSIKPYLSPMAYSRLFGAGGAFGGGGGGVASPSVTASVGRAAMMGHLSAPSRYGTIQAQWAEAERSAVATPLGRAVEGAAPATEEQTAAVGPRATGLGAIPGMASPSPNGSRNIGRRMEFQKQPLVF